MDLQQLLNTPPAAPRRTEIPNTPDIPTPASKATTQSPSQSSSVVAVHGSPSSVSSFSTDTSLVRKLETNRDKRLQIQTALLFNIPYKEICEKLNVTTKQIKYAKKTRLTPQKNKTGRHPLLNTPQKARLQL